MSYSYEQVTGTLTVSSLTATKITASITTGTAARIWNLQVTNPNGTKSNVAPLQINAATPPPSIASVNPNPLTGSASAQRITVNGSGFLAGAQLQASYPGYTTTLPITGQSATQLVAAFTSGTTARTWTLTVTNPGGLSSNSVTLTVTAPVPSPAITSIGSLRPQNTQQTLTITGSGFVTGAKVLVVPAAGGAYTTLQGTQITSITAAQIQVSFNPGSTPRMWLAEVVNPNGTPSNVGTFQVR